MPGITSHVHDTELGIVWLEVCLQTGKPCVLGHAVIQTALEKIKVAGVELLLVGSREFWNITALGFAPKTLHEAIQLHRARGSRKRSFILK